MLVPNPDASLPVTKPYIRFLKGIVGHLAWMCFMLLCYVGILAMRLGMTDLINFVFGGEGG